jgi:hypothetical protein
MPNKLLLPLIHQGSPGRYHQDDEDCTARVTGWINKRVEQTRQVWGRPDTSHSTGLQAQHQALANTIAYILTHRVFNFQSHGRIAPLLPQVQQNLLRQLSQAGPIRFFLLYNGGYRASPFPDEPSLIFEPDQTELMLLHQIALLHEKVRAIYAPGIQFFIVVNNGVALWVNDIPLKATQDYASQLRRMVAWLGAAGNVSVVVQSELAQFNPRPSFEPVYTLGVFSDKNHRLVERFLGRSCSPEEARHRHALYALAEAQWAQDLAPLVAAHDALILRQVGHSDMLSFRPYPGGAIRIQNGSLGFQDHKGTLTPKLITTEAAQRHGIQLVPCTLPWSAHEPSPASSVLSHA